MIGVESDLEGNKLVAVLQKQLDILRMHKQLEILSFCLYKFKHLAKLLGLFVFA